MSYNITDVFGSLVILSDEVWLEHIKAHHPEIELRDLAHTLVDPDEVQQSQIRGDVELFYRFKASSKSGRPKFWMVAVKRLPSGSFVSSAMTKSKIVGAKLIYSKVQRDI